MLGISTAARISEEKPAKNTYFFGPFRLESEFEIPELKGCAGLGTIPVDIRIGGVPLDVDGATYGKFCRVSATEYLLDIPHVARFYVANGSLVCMEPAPDAPAADISTYLLGSVFGALCHQNGLLPLHASSVRVGDGVTAFLGDSGAGKSTMAACLQGRGYAIASDDICLLSDEAGEMRVIPVAGWLKLWRASLDHLGETPEERNRVYSEDDKYRLYLEAQTGERPVLRNLVFLEKAGDGKARLEPLSVPETLARMMQLTYLGYITELTGSHAQVFGQCAHVLKEANGYRLVVPWGFEEMDGVLRVVEDLLNPTSNNGAV